MSVNDFLSNAKKVAVNKTVTLEVNIEDPFVKYAKKVGAIALKLVLLRKRGFPDRTVLVKGGIIFFIEFKKKGKQLKSTQYPVRRMLEKFGFDYYLCDKEGQAEAILDKYISKNRKHEMDSP